MRFPLWICVPALLMLAQCSSRSPMTLEQVPTTRTYQTGVAGVMDAIKLFSVKEGFKLERFEPETGRVIGFKRLAQSLSAPRQTLDTEPSKLVIVNVHLRRLAQDVTELSVHFGFGEGQTAMNRGEETLLVDQYLAFFEFIDSTLRR